MILVSFYRVIKFAIRNFWRNIWLAIVTTTIITMSLFVVTVLISLNLVIDQAIHTLHEQVDVSIYFKPDISEDTVKEFQSSLQDISGIKEVVYISKGEALDSFKEKYKDNNVILESLEELTDNPLGDTLIIQAQSIDDYDMVLAILDSEEFSKFVQERNFQDYDMIISKINEISSTINRIGFFLSILFFAIAVLVTFNTIRIAIYTYREELAIMRLVGASKTFIEWPFFVEGIFYAFLAVIINIMIIYPVINAIQPFLGSFFGESALNLTSYFNSNFIKIFGTELLVTIFITTVSSWLAVRKYLKT